MNILKPLPPASAAEDYLPLLERKHLRIERIVSYGHASADGFWYDQAEGEWLVVLSGWGEVEFEDGRLFRLTSGATLDIPAHTRHRVKATAPDEATVWLAVFYH